MRDKLKMFAHGHELPVRKLSRADANPDGIQVVMGENRTRKQLMLNGVKVNPSKSHSLDFWTFELNQLLRRQAQTPKTPEASK